MIEFLLITIAMALWFIFFMLWRISNLIAEVHNAWWTRIGKLINK